jgi:hypothetical protein
LGPFAFVISHNVQGMLTCSIDQLRFALLRLNVTPVIGCHQDINNSEWLVPVFCGMAGRG